jgi:protein transport protein SEC23
LKKIRDGFEKEDEDVIMERMVVYREEKDDGKEVLRWVDRMIIRICKKFGEYEKDDKKRLRMEEKLNI